MKTTPFQKQTLLRVTPDEAQRCHQAIKNGLKEIIEGNVSKYISVPVKDSNWLIYKDPDLGFQISFPNSWKVNRLTFTPAELAVCENHFSGAKGDYYFDGPEGWIHISIRYVNYLTRGCPIVNGHPNNDMTDLYGVNVEHLKELGTPIFLENTKLDIDSRQVNFCLINPKMYGDGSSDTNSEGYKEAHYKQFFESNSQEVFSDKFDNLFIIEASINKPLNQNTTLIFDHNTKMVFDIIQSFKSN